VAAVAVARLQRRVEILVWVIAAHKLGDGTSSAEIAA
jgi:hypothetical protein